MIEDRIKERAEKGSEYYGKEVPMEFFFPAFRVCSQIGVDLAQAHGYATPWEPAFRESRERLSDTALTRAVGWMYNQGVGYELIIATGCRLRALDYLLSVQQHMIRMEHQTQGLYRMAGFLRNEILIEVPTMNVFGISEFLASAASRAPLLPDSVRFDTPKLHREIVRLRDLKRQVWARG